MSFSHRSIILGAMVLIATVFVVSSFLVDQRLRKDLTELENLNHQKLESIVEQSLERHFGRMQYITEYATLDPAFNPEANRLEDSLRESKIDLEDANRLINEFKIEKKLVKRYPSAKEEDANSKRVGNWQVFKGLPLKDKTGARVAEKRRTLARESLRYSPDLHYFFELDQYGDMVFLEPFDTQKNIGSYNYAFRDYFNVVKDSKKTTLSEGYVSEDRERTQIITVASPILERGRIAKVVATSVANSTLRTKVFRPLRESISLEDDTVIYLIDRHGHVVASSSGPTYFPTEKAQDDLNDLGNLRGFGVLREIGWHRDEFEKGNRFARTTMSWKPSALKSSYSGTYRNWNGTEVLGTFYPISILNSERKWGILIETPTMRLYSGANQLRLTLGVSAALLIVALGALGWLLFSQHRRLATDVENRQAQLRTLSANVAHDLGSPIAALNMLLPTMSSLPTHLKSMLSVAIDSMKDITRQLSTVQMDAAQPEPMAADNQRTLELLANVIAKVVTRKRIEFRERIGLVIDFQVGVGAYGMFAKINESAFERTLSNLINNSAEAIKDSGAINVVLNRSGDKAELVIADDGVGISAHLLPKLFERGATFGRPRGKGLGLAMAKETIESLGGNIGISSVQGKGTKVRIRLPLAVSPNWFCAQLTVPAGAEIIIVDDDASIHDVWDQRFASMTSRNGAVSIRHFNSPEELIDHEKSREAVPNGRLYLIDFEFRGRDDDGLGLIDALKIAPQSVLVTSHDEENDVRLQALGLGIRIVPKTMAAFVPIILDNSEEK